MNDEVRETLAELCKDKRPDDYVFVSPNNSNERLREVKKCQERIEVETLCLFTST
jgi:hypothetical protein